MTEQNTTNPPQRQKLNRILLVVFIGVLLLIAAPLARAYLTREFTTPFYWLAVAYPYLSCLAGVFFTTLLVYLLYHPLPRQNLNIGRSIGLLLCAALAALGVLLGLFGAPIHQNTVSNADHAYHLAIDPMLDVGNPYEIFECDKLGILCREAYRGTYSHDPFLDSKEQLTLILDPSASTLQVVTHDGLIVRTHTIP